VAVDDEVVVVVVKGRGEVGIRERGEEEEY